MRATAFLATAAAALACAATAAAAAAPTTPPRGIPDSDAVVSATVYLTGSTYSIKMGVLDPAGVAWASYLDMADAPISAFGELTVKSSSAYTDVEQMHAAGYVEGALTAGRIYEHYVNTNAWIVSQFKGGVIPPQFPQFFATQDAWARQNIAANTSSPIWRSMGLVLAQFDGLVEGYNAVSSAGSNSTPPLSVYQIQQLGAMGDFLDLIPALSPADAPQWSNMTDAELMDRVVKSTHCSALVKVNGDLTELYYAHSAWFIYQSTIRIWKTYDFDLQDPAVVGERGWWFVPPNHKHPRPPFLLTPTTPSRTTHTPSSSSPLDPPPPPPPPPHTPPPCRPVYVVLQLSRVPLFVGRLVRSLELRHRHPRDHEQHLQHEPLQAGRAPVPPRLAPRPHRQPHQHDGSRVGHRLQLREFGDLQQPGALWGRVCVSPSDISPCPPHPPLPVGPCAPVVRHSPPFTLRTHTRTHTHTHTHTSPRFPRRSTWPSKSEISSLEMPFPMAS
jgi:hypothetical protein